MNRSTSRYPVLSLAALLAVISMAPVLAEPAASTPAASTAAASLPPAVVFDRSLYTPAAIRLSFTTAASPSQAGASVPGQGSKAESSFLDISLILPQGDVVGRRVPISVDDLAPLLRDLYGQLARQDSLQVSDPRSPSRQLFDLLIRPVLPELRQAGVTTLLLSVDSGLQAVPFAALHDGERFLGESIAFSLTPSIGLMPLDVPDSTQPDRVLSAGSEYFEGLSPLPLVPQELQRIAEVLPADQFLDSRFTPAVLTKNAAEPSVRKVHVATHADFLPGGPDKARLYSGTGPISFTSFASLRQRRESDPLDLFALSACRTALGDKDSELGFAGLALQAGSRSAIGTLWYVDDVATSAFFVQFYRYLNAGLPKAEALLATRQAFVNGKVSLQGDRVIGADGAILLRDLNTAQQRRIAAGLQHPYFWAGIQLLGTPW
jgi:CHAT domain-containing protein